MNLFLTLNKEVMGAPSSLQSAFQYAAGMAGAQKNHGETISASENLKENFGKQGQGGKGFLSGLGGALKSAVSMGGGRSSAFNSQKTITFLGNIDKSIADMSSTLREQSVDNVSMMERFIQGTERRHIQMLEVFRDMRDEFEGIQKAMDSSSSSSSSAHGPLSLLKDIGKLLGAGIGGLARFLGIKKMANLLKGGAKAPRETAPKERAPKERAPKERAPRVSEAERKPSAASRWYKSLKSKAGAMWENRPRLSETAFDAFKAPKSTPSLRVTPTARPRVPTVGGTARQLTKSLTRGVGKIIPLVNGGMMAYEAANAAQGTARAGENNANVAGAGVGGALSAITGIIDLLPAGMNAGASFLNNHLGTGLSTDHNWGVGDKTLSVTKGAIAGGLQSAGVGEGFGSAIQQMGIKARKDIEAMAHAFIGSELRRNKSLSGSSQFTQESFATLLDMFNSPAYGVQVPSGIKDGRVVSEFMTPSQYMKMSGWESMMSYGYWQSDINSQARALLSESVGKERLNTSTINGLANDNSTWTPESLRADSATLFSTPDIGSGAGSIQSYLKGLDDTANATPAKESTDGISPVAGIIGSIYSMASGLANITDKFILQKFRETIVKKSEAAADEATFWKRALTGGIGAGGSFGFMAAALSGGGGGQPGGSYIPMMSGTDTGLSDSYYRTLATVESSNDPNAVNKYSGATGLFQFVKDTGRQYGLVGDGFDYRKDAAKSSEAVARFTADNVAAMRARGIPVNDLNAYLAHQLGVGGLTSTYDAMNGSKALSTRDMQAMDANTTDEFKAQYGSVVKAVAQLGSAGAASAYYRSWNNKWSAAATGGQRESGERGAGSVGGATGFSAPGTIPSATGSNEMPGFRRSHDDVDVSRLTPNTRGAAMNMQRMFGQPLVLNSAYRSPEYNKKVGGKPGSMHLQGKAIDVSTSGMTPERKSQLLQAGLASGFTSVGFYPGFMHFDTRNGGTTWGTQPDWAKSVMSTQWQHGMSSSASSGEEGPQSSNMNIPASGVTGMSTGNDGIAAGISYGAAIAGGMRASSSNAFSNGGKPVPTAVNRIQDTPESMARTAAAQTPGTNTIISGGAAGAVSPPARRAADVDSIMSSIEDLGLAAVLTNGLGL